VSRSFTISFSETVVVDKHRRSCIAMFWGVYEPSVSYFHKKTEKLLALVSFFWLWVFIFETQFQLYLFSS